MITQDVIDEFIQHQLHQGVNLHTQEDVFGQCFHVSEDFYYFLKKRSIEAKLVMTMDYLGKLPVSAHPYWTKAEFLTHYVVQVGDLTYDFTIKQFDVHANIPKILTPDQLREYWETVSEELMESELAAVKTTLKQKGANYHG